MPDRCVESIGPGLPSIQDDSRAEPLRTYRRRSRQSCPGDNACVTLHSIRDPISQSVNLSDMRLPIMPSLTGFRQLMLPEKGTSQ